MTRQPDGPSPLDMLEQAMWKKWSSGDLDGAVAIAKLAMPYRHPKHPSSTARRQVETDLQLVDDAELLERLVEARKRVLDEATAAE
jgi:hypothetical protein